MIEIIASDQIVLIQKKEFLSEHSILNIKSFLEMKSYLKDFDFNYKQLFVDCDNDCFLEVDAESQFEKRTIESEVIWKVGHSIFTKQEIDEKISSAPDLFPILATDQTGKDLMLAWGKKESLESAFVSGLGTYFSRSRNGKWVKGEESGHLQNLKEIRLRKNPFSVQYITEQTGAACHTGFYSCFFREFKSNSEISFVYKNKVSEIL